MMRYAITRRSTRISAGIALVLLWACGDDTVAPGEPHAPPHPPPPSPHPFNLSVGYIAREPRLPPPDSVDAPPTAGLPAPGSPVTWVGHAFTTDSTVITGIPYRWTLDGAIVDSGTVDLSPGDTRIEWSTVWSAVRSELELALSVPDSLGDTSAYDDALTVTTDALSVGFWVERSLYDWMRTGGRPGFERWASDQIRRWSTTIGGRKYPTLSPDRAQDRLRLDRVTVLPDHSDYPRDLDTDLVWRFGMNPPDGRFLHVGAPDATLADQTIVLHELLHQRGLTDLYAYDVLHDTPNGSFVGIRENGRLVAGTRTLPAAGGTVFRSTYNGLMGSDYRIGAVLTEHSVFGLNVHAGRRTPRWQDEFGNLMNGFADGTYVNLVPDTTELQFLDGSSPIPNAAVDVFLDWGLFYQDLYHAAPDYSLTADAEGVARLPPGFLDPTPTKQGYPKSWTLIVRVAKGGRKAYVFVPGYALNLLYFRGDSSVGRHAMDVQLP